MNGILFFFLQKYYFEIINFLIDTKRREYSCNFEHVDFSLDGDFLSWPLVGAMQI